MVNNVQWDRHRPVIVNFLALPVYVQAKNIFQ